MTNTAAIRNLSRTLAQNKICVRFAGRVITGKIGIKFGYNILNKVHLVKDQFYFFNVNVGVN